MASCLKRLFFPSTACRQAWGNRVYCTSKGPAFPDDPGKIKSKEQPNAESTKSEVCESQGYSADRQPECPEEPSENESKEQANAESKVLENRDYLQDCLIVRRQACYDQSNESEEQTNAESKAIENGDYVQDCLIFKGPVCSDQSNEREEQTNAESKVFENKDVLIVKGPGCLDIADESEEQANAESKVFENRDSLIVRGPVSPEIADETEFEQPSTDSGDITHLTSAIFQLSSEEVGPGASKEGEYKNPEYYSYHKTSYYDAHLEMLKYRQPQPSNRSH